LLSSTADFQLALVMSGRNMNALPSLMLLTLCAMFVIKAARLCHLVTYLIAHTMLFNNETDVIDNVLLRNRRWL